MVEFTILKIVLLSVLTYGVSLLTFFSGFGLGTLLLPFMTLFFSIEMAIFYTAIIHFLNNTWKMLFLRNSINFKVVLQFGLPAIFGAVAGALLLSSLAESAPLYTFDFFGYQRQITSIKLLIGLILIVAGISELMFRLHVDQKMLKFMPVGGLISGFFGGLSGFQGAFRSFFLLNLGLSKYGFIATSAFIAFVVDFSRIAVYMPSFHLMLQGEALRVGIFVIIASLLGIITGNLMLKKIEMFSIHRLISILLVVFGVSLCLGLL